MVTVIASIVLYNTPRVQIDAVMKSVMESPCFFMGFKVSAFSNMKDFSYGMYLSHCPLIVILNFTNIFEVHPIAGLSFVVGMSFACSYMLEKVVSANKPKPTARQSNGEAYR